ncbi:MAG: monovalent cation/H(+) antiporter subunit G [Synergistaceae bacterium]|jgi:multicomponent Na+:H+ antiporter subunit G|nr:monovalent cation/H(+) antiporter subunit G [Synergistaceae bacterium]
MLLAFFVGLLLLVSVVFNCLGAVSLYRFPDVYTRLHGATKCTTFGTLFIAFALLLYSIIRFMAVEGESRFLVLFIHVLIAAVVLLISNPAGAHALARAAHRSGILPEPAIVDSLEDMEKEMTRQRGGVAL